MCKAIASEFEIFNSIYRNEYRRFNGLMDKQGQSDKPDISSYDASWDEWRSQQVQTITQILSSVFKVEDEARQMQAPSRLLRRSSVDSPENEAEIRQKLTQIRQQISEYEEMLKLGLKRVETALEKIEPTQQEEKAPVKNVSLIRHLLDRLKSPFFR